MNLDDMIRIIGRIVLDMQLQVEQLLFKVKDLERQLAERDSIHKDGAV